MNKKFGIIAIALIVIIIATVIIVNLTKDKQDEHTINMMVIWSGLSFLDPDDQINNDVAKKIKEETGITLNVEFSDANETQKLTQVFSMGSNMPDIIMCPFWGGNDGESGVIKNAAKSGLLLPWDDYFDIAPNIVDNFTVGVAPNFVEEEINDEEFGGHKYVMPIHCPATAKDKPNWGYSVFGRKDILEDLNVDPNSINTSNDVYQLAKKIKEGNYKDINQNPIIPAGNWQTGWEYSVFVNSYRYRQFTPIYEETEGGTLKWMSTTNELNEEVKFMRKMITEGLYDQEAFTQSDTRARQKHINGSYGLTGGHYTQIKNILKNTLYDLHPEMEYVPIGPIYDAAGNPFITDTYCFGGDSGGASMIVTSSCKNPEAVMRYLNYLNSEEGRYLSYLGIEGEDWVKKDGVAKMTDSYIANVEADPRYGINRGIESIFIFGVSRLPRREFRAAKETEPDVIQNTLDEWYPLEFAPNDGILATKWDEDFEQYERMRDLQITLSYWTVVQSAYFAESDEKALLIIDNYNKALNSNGILDDYLRYVKEKVAKAREEGKTILF